MIKNFKIGIDLATRNIGVCILTEENRLINKKVINLDPFNYNYKQMKNNITDFQNKLYSFLTLRNSLGFIKWIPGFLGSEEPNIVVGIEVSNYGNPNLANKFNFYAGVIYDLLLHSELNIKEIKIINANQWEYLCGMKPSDKREKRKAQAREFVKAKCDKYDESWTEDECDAYCIAYLLEELKNTDELHEEVKERKKRKDQKLQKLYFLERKIHGCFTEMSKLDVKRNAKARLTLQNKITKLTKELEDVKKKTQNTK